jgi:hypothetical protein
MTLALPTPTQLPARPLQRSRHCPSFRRQWWRDHGLAPPLPAAPLFPTNGSSSPPPLQLRKLVVVVDVMLWLDRLFPRQLLVQPPVECRVCHKERAPVLLDEPIVRSGWVVVAQKKFPIPSSLQSRWWWWCNVPSSDCQSQHRYLHSVHRHLTWVWASRGKGRMARRCGAS